MPPSTHESTERRPGVAHHVKDSNKPVKFREDSNCQRPSSCMQLNSEKPRAKSWQHSATMFSEELNTLECSIDHIRKGGENAEEGTGKPSFVPTISNGTAKVSQLCAVGDTVPSWNESPHFHTEKLQELGISKCTHQNGDNIESCILHAAEGSSKQWDQNFINKGHFNSEASYINPGMVGSLQELYAQHEIATCSKSTVVPPIRANIPPQHDATKFRIDFVDQTEDETGQHAHSNHNLNDASNILCSQSVDRTRANSKDLHFFQKETLISDTLNITERSIKNIGLNLKQKVSVLPRDSKGRFISSTRMNGGKGELKYSRWKQTDSHKLIKRSKNSVNTSAIAQDTNFAMNAALSNARIGKSISMQTFIPLMKDYHGGKKWLSGYKSVHELNGAVAGQAAFSSRPDFEIFSVGREAPLAITTLNHVEAPLSEKAIDLVKVFIQNRCSDYGYINMPLDSEGRLIKYIPNTTGGFNQLYRIQNSTTDTAPSVTEYSKSLPEFNMVESMDASNNISEVGRKLKISSESILCNFKCPSLQNYSIRCKQSDCCHQYSASKINQWKPDQEGLVQSSSLDLDQIQREFVGNSQIKTFGTSIKKTDTSSTLTMCMHSTVDSGYNGEQKQNSSVLEQSFPEVQSSAKAQPTPQPVMRLMGHNFTIGGENEGGNSLKEHQQGSGKDTSTISKATLDVSSLVKSNTVHSGHYNAYIEGQLYVSYSGHNAFSQHSIGKSNISNCPQNNFKQMESLVACNTTDELRRLNSNVPKPMEKRFPTSCVPCEQSFRRQLYSEPGWTSTSPFCTPIANTLISPVSYLCSNTYVNQGDNMAYKYSCNPITSQTGHTELSRSGCNPYGTYFQSTSGHIRDPATLHQNQVYSENQNSSIMRQAFPIPVCRDCIHTFRISEAPNSHRSLLNQSDTLQLLQNNSKCNSSLPQWLEAKERTRYNQKQSSAPARSSWEMEPDTKQFPCFISSSLSSASQYHCETLNSSPSPTDSAALTMHGRNKHYSTDLFERNHIKLPRNMSRNICASSHEKVCVPDTVDLVSRESKRPSDPRTGTRKKIVQPKNAFNTKRLQQRHEVCAEGPSKKCELLLTEKKLYKRKRLVHHEINSSSLVAKFAMNGERSGNDLIVDTSAKAYIENANSVEFSMVKDRQYRGNCSSMNKVNETFSNAFPHSGLPQQCGENGGTFRKPKNDFLESQFGTFRGGLHSLNTEACLKLAEPMKLSGGAKHILKPPSQNGNAKQSLPIHYTLPFAETTAEERDRYWHLANRYSGEQQRSRPGSKLL